MPIVQQESFAGGEVHGVLDRLRLPALGQSCQRLRNMDVDPRGPAVKRGGFVFLGEITDGAGDPVTTARLVPFEVSEGISYVLALVESYMRIYRDGAEVHAMAAPYAIPSHLRELVVEQALETAIVYHEFNHPQTIIRNGSDSDWSFVPLAWAKDRNTAFPIGPVVPEEMPYLNFSGEEFTFSLLGTPTVSGTMTSPVDYFDPLPAAIGGHVGAWCKVPPAPTKADVEEPAFLQIDTVVDARTATYTLYETSSPEGRLQRLLLEQAFSQRHGWPRAGARHQGRTVMGGASASANVYFASRSGEPFNFNTGLALVNEAVVYGVGGGRLPNIRHLASQNGLLIFSGGSEYADTADPLTPTTASARHLNSHGIGDVPPGELEGAAVFVRPGQAGGPASLLELSVGPTGQVFETIDLTVRAQGILNAPAALAVQQSHGAGTTPRVFVACAGENAAEAIPAGALAVLHAVRHSDVLAWSVYETDGEIVDVCVAGGEVYVAVQRTRPGDGDHVYLERLTPGSLGLDSQVTVTLGAPATAVPGFAHLAGRDVTVIADGLEVGTHTVDGGGSITLETAATTVTAGLPVTARLTPVPVEYETPRGVTAYQAKSFRRVTVRVNPSSSFNYRLQGAAAWNVDPAAEFGRDVFDQVEPETSRARHLGVMGWADRLAIELEHTGVGRFQVDSITYDVT